MYYFIVNLETPLYHKWFTSLQKNCLPQGKCCMQNSQLPIKKQGELENNSITSIISSFPLIVTRKFTTLGEVGKVDKT